MPGLFGYAAAGAIEGAGTGLVQNALAKREQIREMIRNGQIVAREREDRVWRGQQNQANREQQAALAQQRQDFQGSEAEKARDHQDAQAALTRDHAAAEAERARQHENARTKAAGEAHSDRFQATDGSYWERPAGGGPARPITGPDGQQIIGRAPRDPNKMTKLQRLTAISRAKRESHVEDLLSTSGERLDYRLFAENLLVAGVDIDGPLRKQIEDGLRDQFAEEVTREADSRRGESNIFSADVPPNYGGLTREQWEGRELDRRVAAALAELGIGSGGGRPAPADGGQIARAEVPLAPADPARRTAGQVYRNAAGKQAEWTGQGWRPVD